MVLDRRSLLGLGALVAPSAIPSVLRARSVLPDSDITILVGYTAGGGTDIVARMIARQLERRLGRRVSVRNHTGAAGTIPGELLKKGPADGSLLAFMPSTVFVNRLAARNFPFDPLTDLVPLTLAGTFSIGLGVSPRLELRTFEDYVQWLKTDDKARRRLGTTSVTAFIEILSLLLGRAIGTTLTGVEYGGERALVDDIAIGRIPAGVASMPALLPSHRGHQLRLLMTTSSKRLAVAPDVPTATELGYPKLEMEEWFAFFAPAATPAPIAAEWTHQLREAIADRTMVDEMRQLGLIATISTSEQTAALIASHQESWTERMEAIGKKVAN